MRSIVTDCRLTKENPGAEQNVTLLQHDEKSQEHEKSVHGELRLIDTSLLMGDPHYEHVFP